MAGGRQGWTTSVMLLVPPKLPTFPLLPWLSNWAPGCSQDPLFPPRGFQMGYLAHLIFWDSPWEVRHPQPPKAGSTAPALGEGVSVECGPPPHAQRLAGGAQ